MMVKSLYFGLNPTLNHFGLAEDEKKDTRTPSTYPERPGASLTLPSSLLFSLLAGLVVDIFSVTQNWYRQAEARK